MALIPALERQRQPTSVSLRSAWSAKWISGQSWFHSETLPHKYQKQQQQGKQIGVFLFFPPKTLLRLTLLEEFVYPIDCPSWWDMWLWDSVCEYLPSALQNLSLGTDGVSVSMVTFSEIYLSWHLVHHYEFLSHSTAYVHSLASKLISNA